MKKTLTYSSLFSGCGGLDLGFEMAGFQGILACDLDEDAIAVHNENLRSHAIQLDLSAKSISSLSTVRPDAVIAGPPCQGFSTLGKRDPSDPRNSLLVNAARHAISMKPRFIILENVYGAISGVLSQYWDSACQVLRRAGYRTATCPLVSANFGIPQIRRRVVMLGWQGCETPKLEHAGRTSSLSDALSNLDRISNHEPKFLKPGSDEYCIAQHIGPHQKLCNVRGGERAVATWDIPDVFGKTTKAEREILLCVQKLRRQNRQRENGDSDPIHVSQISEHLSGDVDKHVRSLLKRCYLRRLGDRVDLSHTFNGKYRRLSWDHPAPAVDTRFGDPKYFLHPDEHRGFSVREAARIQGFPDNFTFKGRRESQYRMIGNAVPPPLAYELASMVQKFLA